jgi:hypothetical protein
VHAILIDNACVAGNTGVPVFINSVDTSRNLHQLLKGISLYIGLQGVYQDVLNDLKTVLKVSATKNVATSAKE